jgi:type IV pilus assembly protein PilA
MYKAQQVEFAHLNKKWYNYAKEVLSVKEKYMNKEKGFTLAELLIVVAIISALVAISIPIFSSQLDKARASTDAANVRAAKAAAVTDYMTNEVTTDPITYYYDADSGKVVTDATTAAGYKGYGKSSTDIDIDNASGIPKDKIVSITVSDGKTTAAWVLGSGGNSSGNTMPGTDIPVVSSYWPKSEDYGTGEDANWKTITVKAGGIFKYSDGSYYVVVKSEPLTKAQAASGPGGVAFGWFMTEKITGNTISFDSTNENDNTTRGDIYEDNGKRYVFIDGGHVSHPPSESPDQWYLLP